MFISILEFGNRSDTGLTNIRHSYMTDQNNPYKYAYRSMHIYTKRVIKRSKTDVIAGDSCTKLLA